MKISKVIASVVLICGLLGCDQLNEPETGDPDDSTPIAFLDISNARHLFIGSPAATVATKSSQVNSDLLYKITDSDLVEEVAHMDQAGNQLEYPPNPVAVYNVNEEYLIISFGNDIYYIDSSYLVRKSDGAVFSFGTEGFPEENHPFKNSQHIYTDAAGNIYFRSTLREELGIFSVLLLKIDTTDPENITREVYSAPTDHVVSFAVDSAGNALYIGGLRDGSVWGFTRLRKTNGGIYNLPNHLTFWLGLDEHLYYRISEGDVIYNQFATIYKISVDDSYQVSTTEYGIINTWVPDIGASYLLALQGRIVEVSTHTDVAFEIYNPAGIPRVIDTLPTLQTIRTAIASERYYYIAGYESAMQNVVIRVDPLDDSFIYLLNSSELELSKACVSGNDDFVFSALRFADGKKIICNIDVDGELTILDELLGVTIDSLERIR